MEFGAGRRLFIARHRRRTIAAKRLFDRSFARAVRACPQIFRRRLYPLARIRYSVALPGQRQHAAAGVEPNPQGATALHAKWGPKDPRRSEPIAMLHELRSKGGRGVLQSEKIALSDAGTNGLSRGYGCASLVWLAH